MYRKIVQANLILLVLCFFLSIFSASKSTFENYNTHLAAAVLCNNQNSNFDKQYYTSDMRNQFMQQFYQHQQQRPNQPNQEKKVQLSSAVSGYSPSLVSFYDFHRQGLRSIVVYKCLKHSPSVSYFKDKLCHHPPQQVFHYLYHYKDPGFRDYVKQLPGFEDFILDIGKQLNLNSELHKKLTKSNSLQSFAALKKLHQEKVRELEQKAQTKQQIDLRNNLRTRNFNEHGIKLLEHYGVADQFLYNGNSDQQAQLKQIANLMNETGEFKNNYEHSPELSEIAKNTFCFGNLANHANREKMMSLSQMCLDIGQSFLALGRGIVHSGEHTINSLCTLVCHPGQVFQEICAAAKDIGIGIANIATLIPRFETAVDFGDAQMLSGVNQDLDRYCDNVGNFCKSVKHILCDASEIERLEMIGALATDVLTAHLGGKFLSAIPNTAPIRYVVGYKPVALANLGDLGREINQITGLALTKGAKAVKRGFEVVKHHPQIMQGQQFLSEAISYGEHCLKSSNKYLAKLSRHTTKCLLDPERRLMHMGDKIKKIPKNCIAKTKQWLNEEAIVVDTFGNRWTSKIGNDEWLVNLSDKGKDGLILLNDTVQEVPKNMPILAKKLNPKKIKRHVSVQYSDEIRQITAQNRQELRRIRHKYKHENKTYGQMYGPGIKGSLKDKIVELKGISHIMMPELVETISSDGIIKLDVTGMHWDFNRKLEKSGLYRIENIRELHDGCYMADMWYQEILKRDNTFFNSSWDLETLMSKVEESAHNLVDMRYRWDKSINMLGITNGGMQIVSKLTKNGVSPTIYPFAKRVIK